jgi:hypothetical protein
LGFELRRSEADCWHKSDLSGLERSLLQTDPSLGAGVKAGAKILMPDKLNKSAVADRKDWLPLQPSKPAAGNVP